MTNNFRMSYFMPPIAPIRNEQGQTVTPATLTPFCEVSVEQVYQMITCNVNLKAGGHFGVRTRVDGNDHALAAVFLRGSIHQIGILDRRGIDGNFICTGA